MRTVKEVSELTGISVRTLHYYDQIGLLKPTKVTGAGYRLYDDAALGRLQNILLFRQLQFPLKEIKAILDSPDFDPAEAIAQQIRLLELQYRHIGELIALAREIQAKGGSTMNFDAFDQSELEAYKAEAKAKWGGTPAYQEYERRAAARKEGSSDGSAQDFMELFVQLGSLKHLSPQAGQVQEKVAALQAFITEHYYVCTEEILSGLGKLYVEDDRFRQNIDRAGGPGTAAFASQAIAAYCAQK